MLAWQLQLLETHYRVGFYVVEASVGFFSGKKGAAVKQSDPERQPKEPDTRDNEDEHEKPSEQWQNGTSGRRRAGARHQLRHQRRNYRGT